MTDSLEPGRRVSIRVAAAAAAGLTLAGLLVLTLAMILALRQADHLLDRLSRSQDQLARVTRLEADINRLATGAEARGLQAQLDAYAESIRAEARVVGQGAEMAAHQADEAERAEELAAVLRQVQERSDPAEAAEARRRLYALVQEIEASERIEAREALTAMRRLRERTALFGILVLGLFAAAAGAGALAMTRGVIRPLSALEQAAGRFTRGETGTATSAGGFAEIRKVAAAFDRLNAEVTAQRTTLSTANERLEAEVAARTREIEDSRERLAEIDRSRRLFFSKIGHELRTPATVIRGEAEVALRRPDAAPDQLREALEHIAANGAFLQRRLGDLLALAQAEDGRITLKRESFDLAELLRRVAALAEPYIRSAGMSLAADGLNGPGPMVVGDASWLQQAILAVIDNAAKHAKGSRAIRLSLLGDAEEVVVAIADGGEGAPAEALPFLFDSFYRAPGGAAEGAGLGLSVTRWVVEQHGGRAAARNEPGRGLVVELRIPAAS